MEDKPSRVLMRKRGYRKIDLEKYVKELDFNSSLIVLEVSESFTLLYRNKLLSQP